MRSLLLILFLICAIVIDPPVIAQEHLEDRVAGFAGCANHVDEVGERILSLMPEDLETFILARGPAGLSEQAVSYGKGMSYDLSKQLRVMTKFVPKGSEPVGADNLFIRFSVLACRPMDPKGGVATVRLMLHKKFSSTQEMRSFQNSYLGNHIERKEMFFNHAVYTINERLGTSRLSRKFVAFPTDEMIIVSSDHDFMTEILSRTTSERVALPSSLPEWKFVDYSSDVWSVRHLSSKKLPSDKSGLSPKP